MRTVIIEKRVGGFEELSPELQAEVIEKFRYSWNDFDPDFIIEDFCNDIEEKGVDVLPKNVRFSGFYCQGDGSCFSGKVENFIKYISDVVNDYKHLFNSDKEFKAFLRWCNHVYKDCDYNIEINGNDRYFTVRTNVDITTELYGIDHVKRKSEEQEDKFIRILDYIIEQKAIDDNKRICYYIGKLSDVVKDKLEKDDFLISLYDRDINTNEYVWIITW